MTDRLTLTRAFEGAGIKSDAAERIATEIYDAIHDNVATKEDLQRLEAALRADVQRLETPLRAVEIALRAEMSTMEQRLGREVDRVLIRITAVAVVPPHP